MYIQVLISMGLVHLIAVASPGPDFAIVTKNSISSGRSAGFATAAGIATANLIFVVTALSGLASFLNHDALLFKTLSILGAAYLSYIGIKCIKSNGISKIELQHGHTKQLSKSFSEGFFTSITNPKVFLYFTSILSQFMTVSMSTNDKIHFAIIICTISGFWFSAVNLLVSHPKYRNKFIDYSKWIDRGMAVVFLLFSLKVICGVFKL